MHQATLDLQKAMQKMKKSYREYYILKMDVRKFFNSIDKTWDCPCHGSRFNFMGQNIYDPAFENLEIFDLGL